MFHGQAGNGSVGRKEFSLYSSFHFLGNKGESRSCRSRIHVLTLSCVCRWSGCKTKIVANSDFVLNDSVFWCLCHGIFVSWVNYVTGTLCRLSWHTWWTVSWQLFWIVVIYDWVCELCWSLCFFGDSVSAKSKVAEKCTRVVSLESFSAKTTRMAVIFEAGVFAYFCLNARYFEERSRHCWL